MSKVINKDIIDKIAEYAGKGYSKAATAKELNLDRTTVRKYWPRQQEPEEGKEKQPTPHLSLEEEFNLLTKKKETELKLESMQIKVEDTEGETENLGARREVILDQIKLLEEKLGEVESVIDVDKVCELAAKVKNDVTALLDENEPLRKQRRDQEVQKEESLMQARLNEFAWVFPCRRAQAEKIVNRLVERVDIPTISFLHRLGLQLMIAEDLEWETDAGELKPLITECANLLKGNWNETERIIGILYERKKRILIPSDVNMEEKYFRMLDSLTGEVNEHFVEIVFKFNAALSRLAEERFIDTGELLNKETPEPVVG